MIRSARPKYGNRKTTVAGVTFDSAKEARRIGDLRLLQRAGQITDLQLQPRFRMEVNGQHICDYVADARYREIETGELVVEDVKSAATAKLPVFRLKAKLLKALHGVEVRLS